MPEPFVPLPRPPRGDVEAVPATRGEPVVAAGASSIASAPAPASVAAMAADEPPAAPAVAPAPPETRSRCVVLDPFAEHLDDPAVTDLFVNGATGLFVDRGDGPARVARWRASEEEVRELAVALVAAGGRHIDDASPCVDVRLDDGIRVHAVLSPPAVGGTAISVRVPRSGDLGLDGLERLGTVDRRGRELLEQLVARRENVLVTGAAGSGKTTLLSAMLGRVPHSERIVTIEDVAELRIDHPHHVRLEARQPNLEGAGGIDVARLVREALRMRPDRLVVGECRGAEVRDLLSALNTGHDGGAGTLHANGLAEVPARLEALGALAGLDDRALARQVASAIGCILHLERVGGRRRLAAVGAPAVVDDRLVVTELS